MNIKNQNNNIIEILSSNSALKLLENSGNKNTKICLPLSLSIGKFNSIIPFNRSILSEIYKIKDSYDFTKQFNELKSISNNYQEIRVWSSHLDSDDYCLFLLICYLFKDKTISAIFSEEVNWGFTTICSVSKDQIQELEKREHILTKWEKEHYSNEWQKVVNSNKELRYMINGTVVSCNFNNLNSKILNRLKQTGKISIPKFIANLMINPIISYVIFSDLVYNYLIERLENIGKIKSFVINDEKYIEHI